MDIIVFITAAHKREAAEIAQGLVEKKLAACVNMIAPVASVFTWKGKIERCRETLLIVKTTSARLKALERFVKSAHSYDVPEIIAMPIVGGNADYLEWLRASVR
jgi:periplasmic divalent cation tolerance protein